ncbi:MAG TPA: ABC transporter ATP-binding protein [Alphaproteobacteria bacterium]|nr:ABC transporter ATP-binding protein [Alphaproteobacteria bacterium]
MANTYVLDLKTIRRHYGEGPTRVNVLDGVDLAIKAGEAVAIIGPSGSGKSTLLHVAGLLDTPDSGDVFINGNNAAKLTDDARANLRGQSMGFVYQHHHLLKEFTALENVLMPALIQGKATAAAKARANALLKSVGLEKRTAHYPTQLSGGEQQRVAIARALMNNPQLLLADEPTGNLDPHTAEGVADLLFKLVKTEKLALLMVTHNPALAKRCNRTLQMNEGALK